ncbi:MAG: DNA/RNA nuclease SfsA [Lachnospiraceae bacterium]|nr:DNA/RNA nuclease SfsA [Lachnospiraceae bacterium]
MRYQQITQGRFIERPNRFIAMAQINGKVEKCHVKNTGRCRELLIPGAEIWLEKSSNPNRKTAYDLVAVRKQGRIINMDSQAPNQAVREWLEQRKDLSLIKPEYKYGDSRIDFYGEAGRNGERKFLIEVKGVTLEEDGIARFPDAPTERGVKHMLELEKAVQEGYEAWILFVIQMKGIRWFEPNDRTHPQFGETLRRVRQAGVEVLAYDCLVTNDEITLDQPVEIRLQR